MDQPARLHSLDNLRAIMMWLGIVLHVAVNHMTGKLGVPWRDHATSPIADLTFLFIHAFRMPVFFILAGYFVALLVNNRGYDGMLKHRLRRLALPFILFWPVLFASTAALVMMYVHLMARGTVGLDPDLISKGPASPPVINTMHLWFIYYLLWFCVLTTSIGAFRKYIPVKLTSASDRIWKALAANWWGVIVLAMPLAVIGSFYQAGFVAPNGSFVPQAGELVHHGLFFVFGWYLYRHRNTLLPRYSKNCWWYAAGGFLPFIVSLKLLLIFSTTPHSIPHIETTIAFSYNCASWLWSVALIGLFYKYLPNQNRVLQYVSDSSYWVFLVHMLGTIGFGILLYNLPFGPIAKMGINILATTLACLASYHVLVRHTVIGGLLNGKRHPAKNSEPGGAIA
jgi:fucose 4-O-acetylase-like acetyltransferase